MEQPKISEVNKQIMEEVREGKIIFKNLSDANTQRGLKIGIYGDYATGKTHFALTCPEPVYILDTENGSPPLTHNFKGKDIRVLDCGEVDGTISFEKIQNAIDYILTKGDAGTIIIDSVSDLWEFAQEYGKVKIFKISVLDRLKQQWDWGKINYLYLNIIKKLINSNSNIIFTARESEVYAGAGQPTNIVKPKWQKSTGFHLDFVIHNTKRIDKLGNVSFNSNIEKSRSCSKLMGKNIENLTFTELNKIAEENKK
jgi:hypothetical protein